jgi:RNA polymerase subunit RPABC4/transcription elongation factor Spt4
MSADRCSSCSAAVRPDASWCSQCYADLRPAPAPAPQPVLEAPALPDPLDPLTAPLPRLPATLVAETPAEAPAETPATQVPAQAQPGVVPTPTEEPTSWPCGRCRTLVPFDEDECPKCHARFLASPLPDADRTLLDKLPRGQGKTNAALVIVVGGFLLMGLFVGLFALLGSIFG